VTGVCGDLANSSLTMSRGPSNACRKLRLSKASIPVRWRRWFAWRALSTISCTALEVSGVEISLA